MNDEEDYTEFTKEALGLAQEIGEACDTHTTGAILEAISMVLSDMIEDIPMEQAIPILLEVLQDSILMAYEIDTSVVNLGKMQ